MKKKIFHTVMVSLGSIFVAVTVTTIRYCLFAPEQFGQLTRLIG